MRLWLKDSERRPDPAPVQTDDRMPMIVGIAAWAIAFVGLLVVGPRFPGFTGVWLVTCALGFVLGLFGLLYTVRRMH